MQITIDRFEGNFVVVELKSKTMINMPIELMPEGAKEGDILNISIDKEETKKRKKRIEKLVDNLWE